MLVELENEQDGLSLVLFIYGNNTRIYVHCMYRKKEYTASSVYDRIALLV